MIARHRLLATCLTAALTLAASLAAAGTAMASFHFIKISEIHADGDGPGPDTDYLELQMYANGQNFVGGLTIRFYSAAMPFSTYTIPMNVAIGKTQQTILLADGTVNGVVPDFDSPMINVPTNTGAHACYIQALPTTGIDCVAFGGTGANIMGGNPSPFGAPALGGTGLAPGQTLQRKITRRCRTFLEGADDTNNSAADFVLGLPTPRNNSTKPTERACVPCDGHRSTVTGTNKSETLTGTPGRDVIAGRGGNDRLRGLGGNDIICGGKGNDRLIGGKGRDRLFGQAGNDVLRGGPGPDLQVQ